MLENLLEDIEVPVCLDSEDSVWHLEVGNFEAKGRRIMITEDTT